MELNFADLWQSQYPGMPQPLAEYRFDDARKWRFDFAWPAQRVAVEFDGGQYKAGGGRHNTDTDREKLNMAATAGWCVLRFATSLYARDPMYCVETVRGALSRRMAPILAR